LAVPLAFFSAGGFTPEIRCRCFSVSSIIVPPISGRRSVFAAATGAAPPARSKTIVCLPIVI
jgi:hypothetical protein